MSLAEKGKFSITAFFFDTSVWHDSHKAINLTFLTGWCICRSDRLIGVAKVHQKPQVLPNQKIEIKNSFKEYLLRCVSINLRNLPVLVCDLSVALYYSLLLNQNSEKTIDNWESTSLISRSRISNNTVSCICFVDSVGGAMEDVEVSSMGKYWLRESAEKIFNSNGSTKTLRH